MSYREEAENATELETDSVSGSSTGVGLNVQGTRLNRSIRTFADAYVFFSFWCILFSLPLTHFRPLSPIIAVVRISPTNVYQILRLPDLPYSQFQV